MDELRTASVGSVPALSTSPAQIHRLAKHLQSLFKVNYQRAVEMSVAMFTGATGPSGAVLVNGTAPLIANWNAGAFVITAAGFVGTTLNGRVIATDQAKLDTAAANATAAQSAAAAAQGTANTAASAAATAQSAADAAAGAAASASSAASAAQGTANTANTAAGAAQTTANAALPKAGGTISGSIACAGAETFDGRDVSADGAILDTIKTRYIGQNLQTGTAYTLVLTDAGKMIEMNNAAVNTLTIPANATVAFPVDTRIDVCQGGAGQTTIAITTDTLNPAAARKIPAQWGIISLWKKSATVWVMAGGTT